MRIGLIFAWLGFAFMTAWVTYGFLYGNGWAEVKQLWALPWGKVSFADVYTGLVIFSLWIFHRESSPIVAAAWVVALMLLGNQISCLYLAVALIRSRSDRERFWHGRRAAIPQA